MIKQSLLMCGLMIPVMATAQILNTASYGSSVQSSATVTSTERATTATTPKTLSVSSFDVSSYYFGGVDFTATNIATQPPGGLPEDPMDKATGEPLPPPSGGDDIANPFEPGRFVNDDPLEIEWASVSEKSEADFASKILYYKQRGYYLRDMEIYSLNGRVVYAGIFHRDPNKNWAVLSKMTKAQFNQAASTYKSNGYRLIDQEVFVENNNRFYSGVWLVNPDQLDVLSFNDLSQWSASEKIGQMKGQGYIAVDYDVYVDQGVRYYAIVFEKNVKNLDWKIYTGRTDEQFSQDFNALKNTYRVLDSEAYLQGNDPRFTTIWVENPSNRSWKVRRDLSSKQYNDYWFRSRDEGYRPDRLIPQLTENGMKYISVWRQNSDRPSWALKGDVDTIAETFNDDNSLPGLAVAVIKDGKFLYLRGIGHADIANDVIAHSRTVYRLASVSKAIAGVLTAKIIDKYPALGYDDSASDWLPGLPEAHSYTVGDLLNNRSGIGAYGEYVEPNTTAFDNALDASQFLITGANESLPFTIGDYNYSTHGYTPLGAVLEAASGKNIFDLVREELAVAHNLPSMRAVKIDDNVAMRAPIYVTNDVNNTLDTVDDISWKILGGGIESNMYDLARFGDKLLNGELLSDEDRDEMWGADIDSANYTYGWDTGTLSDKDGISRNVYSKQGGAEGSSSYLRLIPEKGIVIAVVTNRRMQVDSGTSPIRQLVIDIGSELMATY